MAFIQRPIFYLAQKNQGQYAFKIACNYHADFGVKSIFVPFVSILPILSIIWSILKVPFEGHPQWCMMCFWGKFRNFPNFSPNVPTYVPGNTPKYFGFYANRLGFIGPFLNKAKVVKTQIDQILLIEIADFDKNGQIAQCSRSRPQTSLIP